MICLNQARSSLSSPFCADIPSFQICAIFLFEKYWHLPDIVIYYNHSQGNDKRKLVRRLTKYHDKIKSKTFQKGLDKLILTWYNKDTVKERQNASELYQKYKAFVKTKKYLKRYWQTFASVIYLNYSKNDKKSLHLMVEILWMCWKSVRAYAWIRL